LEIEHGEIDFVNVNFSYPGQNPEEKRALTNVSFKIKPNTKVAIVGT
jgi:ABC-type multidrug transport system fused ATPase/permease subunit